MTFKEYLEAEIKRIQDETEAVRKIALEDGRNVFTNLELMKLQDLARQSTDMKAALRAYRAWERK